MKREKPTVYNPVKEEKKAYDSGYEEGKKEAQEILVDDAYKRGYIKGRLDGEARERRRVTEALKKLADNWSMRK